MAHPQIGIFALGTLAHAYLEFDRLDGSDGAGFVAAVAGLDEPRTTMGGVNLVAGFRPELWRALAPERSPAGLVGFGAPVVGPDGYTMPATQHDLVLWVAGGAYDIVFDAAITMIADLAAVAVLASEVEGWSYHRDLDLTGFIDGTENPSVAEAPRIDAGPRRSPGRRGFGASPPAVGARHRRLDGAARRRAGEGDRPDQARQPRARPATARLARRPHRPGRVRAHLPPEHGVRVRGRPRHDVRRLLLRAEAARDHAARHGRHRRPARRAHALLPAADRCLLLRPVGRRPRSRGRFDR